MAQMNEDKLTRIARLSGLSLSDEEKTVLAADMARIVPYMERITALDTSLADECEEEDPAKAPASQVTVSDGVSLRTDAAVDAGLTERILSAAPAREGDAFSVPQAVE